MIIPQFTRPLLVHQGDDNTPHMILLGWERVCVSLGERTCSAVDHLEDNGESIVHLSHSRSGVKEFVALHPVRCNSTLRYSGALHRGQ